MRFAVEMDRRQRGGRCNGLRLLISHLVIEAYYFFAHLQNPGPNRDEVAGEEFLLIGRVLLDACHAPVVLAHVGGSNSDLVKQIPRCLIEPSRVPHDIHVSHVVTMRWAHNASGGEDQFWHGSGLRIPPDRKLALADHIVGA